MDLAEMEKVSRELDEKMTKDFNAMSDNFNIMPFAIFAHNWLGQKWYHIIGGDYDGSTRTEKSIKEMGIKIKEAV
jgi:hypothetical protein